MHGRTRPPRPALRHGLGSARQPVGPEGTATVLSVATASRGAWYWASTAATRFSRSSKRHSNSSCRASRSTRVWRWLGGGVTDYLFGCVPERRRPVHPSAPRPESIEPSSAVRKPQKQAAQIVRIEKDGEHRASLEDWKRCADVIKRHLRGGASRRWRWHAARFEAKDCEKTPARHRYGWTGIGPNR